MSAGSVEPRIWTPPLRELTSDTSYGFDVIDFARDVLEKPLDPWQEWLVIHAGELLPDGRPRFRQVQVFVARQNGKTHVPVVLSLFWLYVERVRLVLGTSTNLDTARESWDKAIAMAENHPLLSKGVAHIRHTNGEQTLTTTYGGRYKIAASNRRGGRGLTVDRLILDELREHRDWAAYDAAIPTTSAVPDAQIWMLSNAGDDSSVVLNALREQALNYIETGSGDSRLALFEWSAPEGMEVDDPAALAMANPNLGHRVDLDALIGAARRAKEAGGDQLAGFITEHLCRRVPRLDPAIDAAAWDACLDPGPIADRSRVALCMDVSMDGQHATLYAAAVEADGRVRVDPVAAWEGQTCTQELRSALPGMVARVRPRALGWFPNGPSAAVAADMAKRPGWPPAGVEVEEIRGETTAVCMGFAEQTANRQIAHSGDPLLDAHVRGAERLYQGDGWRFTRKGAGHVDAAYAAAGAVHLARTLPPRKRLLAI